MRGCDAIGPVSLSLRLSQQRPAKGKPTAKRDKPHHSIRLDRWQELKEGYKDLVRIRVALGPFSLFLRLPQKRPAKGKPTAKRDKPHHGIRLDRWQELEEG